MEDAIKNIRNQINKDSKIVSFIKENNIGEKKIERNLSIFFQQKQANDVCDACLGKKTCAMETFLMQPQLEYHHGNINQRLRRCPYVELLNEDLLEMMFFPNNYETGEMFATKERIEVMNEFKRFIEHPKNNKGIYLHGKFGTGKTYLFLNLAKQLTKKNFKVIFAYYPDLVRSMKSSIANNTLDSLVSRLKDIDILMLDDVGGENNTSFVRDEVLGPLLQYRMLGEKPTFMTSNMSLNELRQHFMETRDGNDMLKSDRIIERIRFMMKEVYLDGSNYRQNL